MDGRKDFLSFWDLDDGIEERSSGAPRFRHAVGCASRTRRARSHILGMVFEKASTRTRASFEIAMFELGGHALYLGTQGSQLGRGEPIRGQPRAVGLLPRHPCCARSARTAPPRWRSTRRVPVINGLTDLLHPCQVLADLQTVAQRFRDRGDVGETLRSVKYAWIGDGNNMANSWIEAAGILGLDLALACPAGFEPDADIYNRARSTERGASRSRATRRRRLPASRIVSTDVFASMGKARPTRAAASSRATASTRRSWSARRRTRSSCTASPPTGTRRSRTTSSRARRAWCGSKPRTACTRRRPWGARPMMPWANATPTLGSRSQHSCGLKDEVIRLPTPRGEDALSMKGHGFSTLVQPMGEEDTVDLGDDLVEDADITPTSNRTATTRGAVPEDDVHSRTTHDHSGRLDTLRTAEINVERDSAAR